MEMYFLISAWVACVIAAAILVNRKNHSFGWLLAVLVLGPMWLIPLLCLGKRPPREKIADQETPPAGPVGKWKTRFR